MHFKLLDEEILREGVHANYGSFVDVKTFLDPDGNPYNLIPSDMSKFEKPDPPDPNRPQKPSNNKPNDDSQNSSQDESEKERDPREGKIFIDKKTGKEYVWDVRKNSYVEFD